MEYIAVIIIAVIGLFVHARHSHVKHRGIVERQIFEIKSIDEINAFEVEFKKIMLDTFNVAIGESPKEEDVMRIDKLLKDHKLLAHMAKPELKWRFVILTGAFIGNEMVRNSKFRWQKDDLGKYILKYVDGNNTGETSPFDKIIKQYEIGSIGDLWAYLEITKTMAKLS